MAMISCAQQSCITGAFPEAGYYMIRQRRLLFTEPQPFAAAQHVPSLPPRKIWENTARSYDRALDTLAKGGICAAGVSPETSVPELEALLQLTPPCKFCHYGRVCGAKSYANE
jgi:hypothetical protein